MKPRNLLAALLTLAAGALSQGVTYAGTVTLSGAQTANCTGYSSLNIDGSTGNVAIVCTGGGGVTVPGAPTIGTATPADTAANIEFLAPVSNGGAAITGYTASCTGGAATPATGAGSPLTVTGMVNGTPYSCSVVATNSVGVGAASATVSVTPSGVAVAPGAPTIGAATPGDSTASIAFAAPGSNGGSPITAYTASCTGGASTPATGATSPLVVTGMTNGTPYSCSVVATNGVGDSVASGTVSVTPAAATVPGAPTIGTATPGNAQAAIAFSAPASTGGSAITSYTASCTGGASTPATGPSSPLTVTGMTNGTPYSCSVIATNGIGSGSASGTVSVTPVAGCGPTPQGTTIVNWTTFNSAGSAQITPVVQAGGSVAMAFVSDGSKYPTGSRVTINETTTTGGSNRFDMTISTCPGVFTSAETKCVFERKSAVSGYLSTTPILGYCTVPSGVQYYMNLRPTFEGQAISKVLGNNTL